MTETYSRYRRVVRAVAWTEAENKHLSECMKRGLSAAEISTVMGKSRMKRMRDRENKIVLAEKYWTDKVTGQHYCALLNLDGKVIKHEKIEHWPFVRLEKRDDE